MMIRSQWNRRFLLSAFLVAFAAGIAVAQGPPPFVNPGPPDVGPNGPISIGSPVTWSLNGEPLRRLTGDSFGESGQVTVRLESKVDLTAVVIWLTPSFQECVAVEPDGPFDMPADTPVDVTFTLLKEPPHTLGGTAHVKQNAPEMEEDQQGSAVSPAEASEEEEMDSHRTFPMPLPINVFVDSEGGEAEEQQAGAAAVVNGADYREGGVAPGQVVTIFGQGLGPPELATLALNGRGRVAAYLGDTQVLFDGLPAALLHARSDQVAAVVPFAVAGKTEVEMIVTHKGGVSPPVRLPVVPADPALFSIDGTGQGQGAILNHDFTLNSPDNPAQRGSFIVLYGTGAGLADSLNVDGAIVSGSLPRPVLPVSVAVGGRDVDVLYAGGAPGLINAVIQVNVFLDEHVPGGAAVPVALRVGEASSSAEVTVAIE